MINEINVFVNIFLFIIIDNAIKQNKKLRYIIDRKENKTNFFDIKGRINLFTF